MDLNDRQREDCETSRWDFSDLRALFPDSTLEPTPESSHTEGMPTTVVSAVAR